MGNLSRLSVFLVLGLFLVGLVPVGFAEEGSTDATTDSDNTDKSDDNNEDSTAEADADVSARVKAVRVKADARVDAKADASRAVARLEEVRANFKDKQTELLNDALLRCEKTDDAEDCTERLQKRIDAVGRLEAKQLEQLEKFKERRAEVSERFEAMKEKIHFKKFKADSKARLVAARELSEADGRFKQAQRKFDDAQRKQKETLSELSEEQTQWKEECADTETDGCKKLHVSMVVHAQAYFTHVLDVQSAHVDKLIEKVKSSETLTEQEATDMLAKLDALNVDIEAARVRVAGLSETSTRDDVKAVRDVVKEITQKVNHGIKLHAGRVVNAHIGGILVSSEKMSEKLAKLLERMTEKGADVTAVDPLVAQFDILLQESKTAYEEAQTLFEQAAALTADERADVLKQAQDKKKAARDKLNEAHKVLRDIHAQLKDQKQLETLEEVNAETEVEAEATV